MKTRVANFIRGDTASPYGGMEGADEAPPHGPEGRGEGGEKVWGLAGRRRRPANPLIPRESSIVRISGVEFIARVWNLEALCGSL